MFDYPTGVSTNRSSVDLFGSCLGYPTAQEALHVEGARATSSDPCGAASAQENRRKRSSAAQRDDGAATLPPPPLLVES